jgi:hypothetical protein
MFMILLPLIDKLLGSIVTPFVNAWVSYKTTQMQTGEAGFEKAPRFIRCPVFLRGRSGMNETMNCPVCEEVGCYKASSTKADPFGSERAYNCQRCGGFVARRMS